MRQHTRSAGFPRALAIAAACLGLLLPGPTAHAQVSGGTDVNTSQKAGRDNECAIIKNPSNNLQLFMSCNTNLAGLFAARSTDGGLTWIYPDPADQTLADGDAGQGAQACCDPTLAWDTFGNLYFGYLDSAIANVVVLISTDSGATFNNLANFAGSVDQPTVVAANTTAAGAPVALWVVWNLNGSMVARGAAVTGLGTVGVFNPIQNIPGTNNCSFGDIAIAPDGTVVQACQNPTGGEGPATINVNTDTDGLGPNNFGAAVAAITTNVGGFDFITPQNSRSVDAEAGLVYDSNPASPRFGRLYLVYTEEPTDENNDTDIMVRFSDDDGANWSAPIRANDDATTRSQFLPKIASNTLSGNVSVCWHDARNSATNTAMQVFCTIATPTPAAPAFMANAQIGDGASTSTGTGIEFGDYAGLTYFQGIVHPAWADTSNSTADNPNGTANFDAYTDRVTGGAAANEGDPHMTTVDAVHYDFQSAGEFVSLRGDGLEIQTRQTAVATTFFPGANAHTGLATCVSLNTAVAAQVGEHRVSYQPNISGVPDPSGLQLRVDGALTTLGALGIDLGSGGRIVKAAVGDGIEIQFPNESKLIVTPGWWNSQSKWYLNINVYQTPATEGTLGALARGSWLPALPDGTSLGPRPSGLAERYVALNDTFANAWRVTDSTSLFDYAPGSSTADFAIPSWPLDSPPCVVPEMPQVEPLDLATAQTVCAPIADANRQANCVFDVQVTGETGFADTYLLTQQLEDGSTTIIVSDERDPTRFEETATFAASVVRTASRGGGAPTGAVQFTLDGNNVGGPMALDSTGRATWSTATLAIGRHQIAASYIPSDGSVFLASSSPEESHTVNETDKPGPTEGQFPWWVVLLVIVLILVLLWFLRRS